MLDFEIYSCEWFQNINKSVYNKNHNKKIKLQKFLMVLSTNHIGTENFKAKHHKIKATLMTILQYSKQNSGSCPLRLPDYVCWVDTSWTNKILNNILLLMMIKENIHDHLVNFNENNFENKSY
jgi:hypothetical protein